MSSLLARVEVHRALRRLGAGVAPRRRADRVLALLSLMAIDAPIVAAAESLAPTDLRPLDAVHLATALALGADLAGIVTYDARLGRAAAAQHLRVYRPA